MYTLFTQKKKYFGKSNTWQWFTRSLHESKVGTLQILSKRKVKMETFSTWLVWLPKFVLITYFRPSQYKVPLRMVEYCLEVLTSCLTALRGSITRGWILSQGSALMLQDSQMTKNTGRTITRVLCFHLLIKRYVLFNSHIFTFFLSVSRCMRNKMARFFKILYNGYQDGWLIHVSPAPYTKPLP